MTYAAPVSFHRTDVEDLAEALYGGWVAYEHRRNVAPPRWFALRDDLKAHWRIVARQTLRAYERAGRR